MIRLVFLAGQNKVFMILIKNREIYYNDQMSGVQMLYPTPSKRAIELGGEPSKEDMEEYNMCKTESELMAFVIRDANKTGSKLIKHQVID